MTISQGGSPSTTPGADGPSPATTSPSVQRQRQQLSLWAKGWRRAIDGTAHDSYQFGHEWEQERDRLASIEQFNDPGTIRHLEQLGVASGWQCLEIGAGRGSIARWLSQRVGPTGTVVATDVDTRFLHDLDCLNLEVVRHDVTVDELPSDSFDLVHERAVLLHLQSRRDVLGRLVDTLRPGGWLLCEDTEFATFVHGSPSALHRTAAAMVRLLRSTGAEPDYGRHLLADFRAAGLTDVDAEGRVYMIRGAHPSAVLPRFTLERLRAPLIAAGDVTADEVDEAIASFDDPAFTVMSHTMVAVWGRKPS